VQKTARSIRVGDDGVIDTGVSALDQALIEAARAGDEALALELIEKGASGLAQQPNSYTALMQAAETGVSERCARALLAVSDAMATNDYAQDALMIAAHCGNTQTLRALMAASDLSRKDRWGRTALMLAAKSGNAEAVRLLLPVSDPKELSDDGFSALMMAIAFGESLGAIEVLLPCSDLDLWAGAEGKKNSAQSLAQDLRNAELREAALRAFGKERARRESEALGEAVRQAESVPNALPGREEQADEEPSDEKKGRHRRPRAL
jgi:uncharacterized protein